jgi:hypothetical protein
MTKSEQTRQMREFNRASRKINSAAPLISGMEMMIFIALNLNQQMVDDLNRLKNSLDGLLENQL